MKDEKPPGTPRKTLVSTLIHFPKNIWVKLILGQLFGCFSSPSLALAYGQMVSLWLSLSFSPFEYEDFSNKMGSEYNVTKEFWERVKDFVNRTSYEEVNTVRWGTNLETTPWTVDSVLINLKEKNVPNTKNESQTLSDS